MEHRIRSAGLIINNNSILLVLHRHPGNGDEWWVPPGGGLKSIDNSIFDTAKREIFEETGLTVVVNRISYIREYRETSVSVHHLEFFMPVESYSGQLTIKNVLPGDEDALYVKDVKWMKRPELDNIVVYPEWLRSDEFWQAAEQNFPDTRYTEVQFG